MIIITDIFPAHVAVAPAGAFENLEELKSNQNDPRSHYVATTRVVVFDNMVVVAVDSPEGAKIIFREKYSNYFKGDSPEKEHRLITESGKMMAFRKDTNCGCGSRLRSWNPYKTVNSIMDQ